MQDCGGGLFGLDFVGEFLGGVWGIFGGMFLECLGEICDVFGRFVGVNQTI